MDLREINRGYILGVGERNGKGGNDGIILQLKCYTLEGVGGDNCRRNFWLLPGYSSSFMDHS